MPPRVHGTFDAAAKANNIDIIRMKGSLVLVEIYNNDTEDDAVERIATKFKGYTGEAVKMQVSDDKARHCRQAVRQVCSDLGRPTLAHPRKNVVVGARQDPTLEVGGLCWPLHNKPP